MWYFPKTICNIATMLCMTNYHRPQMHITLDYQTLDEVIVYINMMKMVVENKHYAILVR